MSVTVLDEKGLYTFEGIKDPVDAFTILNGTSANQPNTAGGSVPSFNAANIRNKITPDELRQNKDWIEASRIMFQAKERKPWTGNDEALANWGLNSMAWFQYNLTLGTIPDAVSLKNAPPDQRKAFLFMMDTFDKTAYSWEGFGRGLKAVGLDPSTYVGLATFGFGTAAAKGAGFATKEGIKAALRSGLYGAIEGGIYGAVQEGAQEKARVYADPNKDSVDWGKIGFGTLAGTAVGGLAGGLIPAGINQLTGRAARDAGAPLRDAGSVTGRTVTEPAQGMLDLVQPPMARQPELPMDMPIQRNLDELPTWALPPARETAGEMEERLMQKWGVDPQLKMDLPPTPEGPFARAGQGDLFEGLPRMTKEEAAAARKAAYDAELNKIAPSNPDIPPVVRDGTTVRSDMPEAPRPRDATPTLHVDGVNTTVQDVVRLMKELGSMSEVASSRVLGRLISLADPLTQKITSLSPDELKQLAGELRTLAKTDPERKALQGAVENAEKHLIEYIQDLNKELKDTIAMQAAPKVEEEIASRLRQVEKVESTLRPLVNRITSDAGFDLRFSAERIMKGDNREKFIKEYARKNNLDTNDPKQLSQAVDAFFADLDNVQKRTKIQSEIASLKRQVTDILESTDGTSASRVKEATDLIDQIAQKTRDMDLEAKIQNPSDITFRVTNAVTGLVLGPSSVTISLVTNAMQALFLPLKNLVGRGIITEGAMQAMFREYAVMWRLKETAYRTGRLSFDLGHSILLGKEGAWIQRVGKDYQLIDRNTTVQFLEHNVSNIFFRLLNGTDEMFHTMTYHALLEGDALFNAFQRAKGDTKLAKKLAEEAVKELRDNAVNKNIDELMVTKIRRAGLERGLRGDALQNWVINTIENNKEYLGRAVNERGIDIVNDLYFRREFSKDNKISALANKYEEMVRDFPAFRLFGQLFFRTPVRVFEQGMRLTPGLNLATSAVTGQRFLNDLRNLNGEARMYIAQGELLASYGIGMATLIGYANGNITGSGGVGDYKVERHMGDNPKWRPYSFRIGDTYISYRNFDPLSTPLKVLTNFFEMNQFAVTTKKTVSSEPESNIEASTRMFLTAMNSVYGAVKDANLTAGVAELDRMVRAIGDPERNETAIQRFVGSKAQLLVPSVIRRGVRYFGDETDVSNDPRGWDQTLSTIINPASDRITHQFDALGFKRKNITQGFLGFMGFDVSEGNRRGLSERDSWSMNQIAAMAYVTGKSFVPSPKPDASWGLQSQQIKDLREAITSDGQSTIYNRAMEQFNKMWPQQAYSVLKATEKMPTSPKGQPEVSRGVKYRDEIFRENMNRVWKVAVRQAMQNDGRILQGMQATSQQKLFNFSNPPVTAPFQ